MIDSGLPLERREESKAMVDDEEEAEEEAEEKEIMYMDTHCGFKEVLYGYNIDCSIMEGKWEERGTR